MSSKKKTTQTQTTTAASWAQPAITGALSGLQNAAGVSNANAANVQPYLMQAIQNLGTTPSYLSSANSALNNLIQNGSTNPYTSQVANSPYESQLANYNSQNPYTSQIAQAGNTANPYASTLANAGSQANPYLDQIANQKFNVGVGGNKYIDDLASGKNEYIDKLLAVNESTNPYASAIADRLGQQTGAQYASSFGGAGRSGSGLAALLGTQGIGDTLNSFYSNQYATDQGYRNSALTNAANLKYQGLNAAAGYTDSDLARQQAANIANAQFQQNALTSAAGLSENQLNRGLQGTQSAAQLADNQANRNLQGLTSAADLANTDSSRNLQSLLAASQLQQTGANNAASLYQNGLSQYLNAINSASGLYSSQLNGANTLGNLAQQSTLLPLQGASAYSNAVTGLTSPYNTTTGTATTKSGGLGSIVGAGLQLGGLLTGGGGLSGLLGGASTIQPLTQANYDWLNNIKVY